jgi:hypothetical protein|tara:strand:+ start:16 stop:1332 length:1317 start_codon:yes stop_codon:yes gene_type:complete
MANGLFTGNPINRVSSISGQPLIGGSEITNLIARSIGGLVGRDMRTRQEKLTQALSQIDPKAADAELLQLSALAKFGQPEQQVLAARRYNEIQELKREKNEKQKEKEQVTRFRKSLIERSNSLGGSEDRANSILEAPVTLLGKIREEILAEEQAAVIKNSGLNGRFAVGEQAGLTKEQVKGYSGLTDEQYSEVISGLEADDVAYKDTNSGEVNVYRVNKYGMVATQNPNGTTKWVSPTTLDLVPAAKETKDVDKANEITAALVKEGTPSFVEVTTAAREAYRALQVNQDRLDILDANPNLPLGSKLSQLSIDAQLLLANSLGMTTDGTESAEQAQLLIAQGVEAVGQAIKAFGAGTGLSDADRLFAQLGAGATAELTAGNIRQLIEAANDKAREQIALHQSIYSDLKKADASPASLAFYKAGPDLSPNDLSRYYDSND